MLPKPDLSRTPLENWFPWDCPVCRKVWWYMPGDVCTDACCYSGTFEVAAAEDREKLREFVGSAPLNAWWKVFAQAQFDSGRRHAFREAGVWAKKSEKDVK